MKNSERRVKRALFVLLALILSLAPLSVFGATATKKPVTPTTRATTAAKKPVVKKVVVKKYIPRKKIPVTPSPRATTWPPRGFQSNNGVFAKFPTDAELVSLLSAKTTLALTVRQCKGLACGAVYIGSDTACTYWEINSRVFGPNPADVSQQIEYGSLRTLLAGTKAHQILPVILVSGETLFPHEVIVLQVLGITHDAFYQQISTGKSLTQIAGSKMINSVVSAIVKEENHLINTQLAAGTITMELAQQLRDATSTRVATELTSYDLSVGGIKISCWTTDPTSPVPNIAYIKNPNHF